MRTGIDIVSLAQKIQANQASKADFIAPAQQIALSVEPVKGENKVVMNLPTSAGEVSHFPVRPIAHDQIGAFTNIPGKYYDRMLADSPDLLVDNVNHWLRKSDGQRMVRTLGGENRAFLSNRYQRIENEEIAEVALPILMSTPGLSIVSCEVTERRLYIQATTSRIQGDVKVGDTVQAGLIISNSEIGLGSVSVSSMFYRLRCLNGMVGADKFRQNHLGKRLDDNDALYQDDTKKADDKAVLLKVRDTVQGYLTAEFFNTRLAKMQALTDGRITGKVEKAVEVLAQKLGATETEGQGILRSLIEGADLSRWGVLNAVTHQSHSIADYDRSVDFEAMGGKLLDLPANDWREILEAA